MKHVIALLWCVSILSEAQELLDPAIRGLRVVGEGEHGLPVVVGRTGIRVEFDVAGPQRTDYRIRIRHCDKDGRITDNVFVNDPHRLSMLEPLPAQPAPTGVHAYQWTYAATIPGPKGLEEIPFSGYYRGWVLEAESGRDVATFEFVCADQRLSDVMRVRQRRLPSMIAPYNEAIAVSVVVRMNGLDDMDGPIQSLQVRSIDVVKNREWSRRTRIEPYDADPNTWIEGAGTDVVTYVAGGIMPGNEYRQLDVRNLDLYHVGDTLRSRSGADVSRFFFLGRSDHNGLPAYIATGRGADYEEVEFQFLWHGTGNGEEPPPIHVVGEFNGWTVRPEWRLAFKPDLQRYSLVRPLRRGRFDYQYVFGDSDWVRVEGNDWRTRNLYTALVVYHDLRYGGFDRIIGVEQTESTGIVPSGGKSD